MTIFDTAALIHDAIAVGIVGLLLALAIGALLYMGDRGRSW